MAGESRKRGANQAWKAGGGGDAPRGPKYKWKPADDGKPPSGGRRVKQLLLGLLAVGCVGGIAYLIWLLQATPQATLVGIGADPAQDAEVLSVPLDLYGWQTAQAFAKLGHERHDGKGRKGPDVLALPSDAAGLPAWADNLRHADYDPLVIYVGLPCGTDAEGRPVLFTGGHKDRVANRLPVAELIKTLAAAPLDKKKKVLLLDPGRLPPDPAYGQLHDDFAARVKDMSGEVKKAPNLVVIVGASPGQQAWESEELRATAFGHAVLRALRGHDLPAADKKVITARQLFESVKKQTEQWSGDTRPTAQQPFLLPEGEEARADAIEVGTRPDSLTEPAAAGASDLGKLADRWRSHDRLATQVPRPAAYAPRAWRRYRELLLRYEAAVRAGEAKTADLLAPKLTEAEEAVRAAAALPEFQSARNSVALWEARQRDGAEPPADDAAKARLVAEAVRNMSRQAAFADQLQAEAARLAREFLPAVRPAEAHLPVMVHDFYTKVLAAKEPPAAAWSAAIGLRASAERAALGLPDGPTTDRTVWPGDGDAARAAPFPERVWPAIAQAVVAGDASRRAVEDRLFSTDTKDPPAAGAAKAKYDEAVAVGVAVRTAAHVRDDVFADLPYLARWAGERAARVKEADRLARLWQAAHALAAGLDALPEKPPAEVPAEAKKLLDQARAVATDSRALRAEFAAEVLKRKNEAAGQWEWFDKQQVLAVPLLAADERLALLNGSRRASGELQKAADDRRKGEPRPATQASARPRPAARDVAVVRGLLAKSPIAVPVLAADVAGAARGDFLDPELAELLNTPADNAIKWGDRAAALGGNVARQYLAQSDDRPPVPKVTAAAERQSRSAVPLDPEPGGWVEPAAVNLRLRWRQLLLDHGLRAATDHWYTEVPDPATGRPGRYFDPVVRRFREDAAAVVATLKDVPSAETADLDARLAAAPLAAADLAPVTWTSDQKRQFTLGLPPLPKGYPVAGTAVAVGQFAGLAPMVAAGPAAGGRPALPLAGELAVRADLTLDSRVASMDPRKPGVTVYFRGQRPTQRVPLDVRREPYLVLSDPLPRTDQAGERDEQRAAVAVRAAKGVQLGSVSLVLDYSASMSWNLDGARVENFRQNPTSRFYHAQAAIKKVLQALPARTPLRVRVFPTAGQGSEVVFTTKAGQEDPGVPWREGDDPDDGDLGKLTRKLFARDPDGVTPLQKTILTAAKEDFGGTGSRTLIVVTDGADNTTGTDTAGAALDALRDEMADWFKTNEVRLYVVRVGRDGLDKSDRLFGKVDEHKLPGYVWTAEKLVEVEQHLLDAIRPKLRLEQPGVGFPEAFGRYGKLGWPSRPRRPATAEDDGRSGLNWSPLLAGRAEGQPTRYEGTPLPAGKATAELRLDAGDRMILDMEPAEGGGVSVRRGLYADYLRGRDGHVAEQGAGPWVGALWGHYVDADRRPPRYNATVFLERKVNPTEAPIELLRPSLDRGLLLWWGVTPAGKDKADGPVRVTKRYAEGAPAWEVWADKWTKDGPSYPRPQLRAWVGPPPEPTVVAFPPKATPDGATFAAILNDPDVPADRRKVEVRVSFERHPLVPRAAGDGPDDEEADCLVVRVTHPPGRPVVARLVHGTKFHAKHLYFHPGEYTALFGRLTRDDAFPPGPNGVPQVVIELVSVGPLQDKTATTAVTLAPPAPDTTPPASSRVSPSAKPK